MSKEVVDETWQKLRGRREFLLEDGGVLNKNPDAKTILDIYFSDTSVRHALIQLDAEKYREAIVSAATTLLNELGRMRLGHTFSRAVRDRGIQEYYDAKDPAEALRNRVGAEVERLITDGFLKPLEELLPEGLLEAVLPVEEDL